MSFSKRIDEDGPFLIPQDAAVAFRCGRCGSVQLVLNIEKKQLMCLTCGNIADIEEHADDAS